MKRRAAGRMKTELVNDVAGRKVTRGVSEVFGTGS